jgi:hypothetical protein
LAQGFAELFDTVTTSWRVVGVMPTPRTGHAAALLPDGNVLTAGGSDGTQPVAAAEIFHYGTFDIMTSAGTGGDITAGQKGIARKTDSALITVTPDSSHLIAGVTIDGVSQIIADPRLFTVTFNAVTANHTISATFVKSWQLDISLSSSTGGSGWVTDGGSYICDSTSCQALTYADGSQVTLHEFPDSNSLFTDWSIQDCVASQTCGVSMTGPQSVTAIFDRLMWVKNDSKTLPYYGLLTNAYKDATTKDIIKAQATTFDENLSFNLPVDVTVGGGFAPDFLSSPGYTVVHGVMKVSGGKITVRRIIIR